MTVSLFASFTRVARPHQEDGQRHAGADGLFRAWIYVFVCDRQDGQGVADFTRAGTDCPRIAPAPVEERVPTWPPHVACRTRTRRPLAKRRVMRSLLRTRTKVRSSRLESDAR